MSPPHIIIVVVDVLLRILGGLEYRVIISRAYMMGGGGYGNKIEEPHIIIVPVVVLVCLENIINLQ